MLLSLFLLPVTLSACSFLSQSFDDRKSEATLNFPNDEEKQNTLIVPPVINDSFSSQRQGNARMRPGGLPELRPLKGVKVDQLFSQNIRNTNQRFDRLENTVLDLAREFETIKPAIIRLVAVESDIQQLIDQLEVTLQDQPPAATPIALNKQVEAHTINIEHATPNVTKPSLKLSQNQPNHTKTTKSGGASVKRLRIGRHDRFTRIVMDVNRATPHSVELDNQENIMLIELPEAKWDGLMSNNSSKSPVIKSYSVQPINNGTGSRVTVILKNAVTIIRNQVIPSHESSNFRIFIDIRSSPGAQ